MQENLSKPPQKFFISNDRLEKNKYISKRLLLGIILGICALIPFISLFLNGSENILVAGFAKIFISWGEILNNNQPQNETYNYFQAITPILYKIIIKTVIILNCSPNFVITFILAPICNILFAISCFALLQKITGKPFFAFLASLAVLAIMDINGIILAGSPKGLSLPFLIMFFYFNVSKSFVGKLISIALAINLYPPFALLILLTMIFQDNIFKDIIKIKKLSLNNGLFIALVFEICLSIYFYYKSALTYGNIAFLNQAWDMNVFHSGQFFDFFNHNIKAFLFTNQRSAFMAGIGSSYGSICSIFLTALILFINMLTHFCSTKKLSIFIPKDAALFHNIFKAVIVFYLLSSLFSFIFYLPSAVTATVLLIITPINGFLIAAGKNDYMFFRKNNLLQKISALLILLLSIVVLYNAGETSLKRRLLSQDEVELANFIKNNSSKQPTVIAGLSPALGNLEIAANVQTIGSRHHLMPFSSDFFIKQFNQISEMLNAMFSFDKQLIDIFISKNNISYLLLDNTTQKTNLDAETIYNNPEYNWYFKTFKPTKGATPAFLKYQNSCLSLKNSSFILIDAQCLLDAKIKTSPQIPKKTRRTPFIVK
ncbi:MAG: hypothetical protein AB7U85_05245 [Alphaproteobacteria bacterium]